MCRRGQFDVKHGRIPCHSGVLTDVLLISEINESLVQHKRAEAWAPAYRFPEGLLG